MAAKISPKTHMTMSIIGCGTMGSAILSGVLKSCAQSRASGEEPKITRFIATVQSEGSAEGLQKQFSKYSDYVEVTRGENVKAMKDADIVLLACKPYVAETVLSQVGVMDAIEGKLVISVLVGSPISKLQGMLDKSRVNPRNALEKVYIHRAMCNSAAEFGESMTVIEINPSIPPELLKITEWVFQQVGKTAAVLPELFDIGGVMAGTPASFLSIAFDGMLDGAVSQGLKRGDAKMILTQSLISMAKLLQNGEHPASIREKAASPKGTTIAGILSLEADSVRHAFSKAVIASSTRSLEIGK